MSQQIQQLQPALRHRSPALLSRLLLCLSALVGLLAGLPATSPAWAQQATGGQGGIDAGGNGANGGNGGDAGAAGSNGGGTLPGSGGLAGTSLFPNGGFGGLSLLGGGGGGGGGASNTSASPIAVTATVLGGAGGVGGRTLKDEAGAGGGGAGGDGLTTATGVEVAATGIVQGGNGGNGASFGLNPVTGGGLLSAGGGGGGAGAGLVENGAGISVSNAGAILGGFGGNGGDGGGPFLGGLASGGGGGGGGAGISFSGAGDTLVNSGVIAGGAGGAGGASGDLTGSKGGNGSGGSNGGSGTVGGAGGAGVIASNITITNSGAISGGTGGNGGNYPLGGGDGGRGGDGIIGSGLTIINSGAISGGTGGAGGTGGTHTNSGTNGNAITFTGGINSLELQAGWQINGNVVGQAGSTNTLILGGATTDATTTFDVSAIAPAGSTTQQYQGFTAFEKTGASTWTLTGSTLAATPWTISAGTLQIGNGGTTGSIVGNVIDNATLAFDRSDTVSFGGVISGSGGVNQIGSGTLTLTGTNTYTGTTTVSAGTLVLASAASITSNVTNAATFQNSGTVTGTVTNANMFDNAATGAVSGRLTNTAGTTTNAGALNGGVNVSGGTFTQTGGSVSGGLSNAATTNANGGAINGAIANLAGTFNVGGTVTSNSTFDNAGGATFAIGAAGNYTLQGLLTNSGVITVAGGGQLDATVGGITNAAGGTLSVAVGGTVKDDLNNAGTMTNNGNYLANVATNTGTITNNNIWTGNVASNVGTIINNLTWSGAITTSGTFTNSAGATVTGLVTNSGTGTNLGTLSGGLTMTGGTFNNAGTIAGAITVSGGALFGTGSIGALNIANGGTFAAGDGRAGTSTSIAGSLAFASGAIYLVQVNPTTSSYSTVTGTATLGGATVSASFAAGSYVEKQYMILAAGSISGTFNPTVANIGLPSGFKTTLSYDGTHAYLDLAIGFVAPSGTGLSGNQQNIGNALVNFFNSNGSIPIVFGSLTPAGLTQLSGELGSAPQQTTFNAMSQFMGLMTDPLTGRGDGINGATSAPGYAEETSANASSRTPKDALAMFTKAPPVPFVPRWSVWAAGYGGSQTTDGNAVAGSNDTRSSVFGTAVGADYQFAPDTLAGFALAGGGTNFSVNNLGSGRSDLFQAAAYMRHTNGAAYVTGALAYGWQDITTNRAVTIAGLDQLRAEFKANAWSGRLEGGYRFVAPWIGGVGITPYAAGQFTTFDLPAYAENVVTGTANFALAYAAKSVTDSRSELGLRTDKAFAMTNGILTLRGRLAWAHDFNPDRSIGATFQSLPGASFVVGGAAQASDLALTTASAEMKWSNGWSAAGTFEGEFSKLTRSYAGKGVVKYRW